LHRLLCRFGFKVNPARGLALKSAPKTLYLVFFSLKEPNSSRDQKARARSFFRRNPTT
jgi:hypothetical protein